MSFTPSSVRRFPAPNGNEGIAEAAAAAVPHDPERLPALAPKLVTPNMFWFGLKENPCALLVVLVVPVLKVGKVDDVVAVDALAPEGDAADPVAELVNAGLPNENSDEN